MILSPGDSHHPLVDAGSPVMRSLLQLLPTIAAHDAPVVLLGESGVGKTTIARAIHQASPRRGRRLAVIDCLALAADPPKAPAALTRRLKEAAGGALLLEEVATLPDRAQLALATFLEDERRASNGSSGPRIIATSSRDLDAEVLAGHVRRQLFTRIGVVEIRVPPLRERREDVLLLASQLAEAFARREGRPAPEFTLRARQALLNYPWPGNIPELRNAVQRAMILADSPVVDVDALPPRVSGTSPEH